MRGGIRRPTALLDVASTAEYLDMTESAVRHQIERGRLPALKLGGRVFVRQQTLDHHIETGEVIDFTVPDLLAGFTAIDFRVLVNRNYMSSEPDSVSRLSGAYADYMWLFEKAGSAGSTGEYSSRNVALFKLVVVQKVSTDSEQVSLIYQRIT